MFINENLLLKPESAEEMEEGDRYQEMRIPRNLVPFGFPYFTFIYLDWEVQSPEVDKNVSASECHSERVTL